MESGTDTELKYVIHSYNNFDMQLYTWSTSDLAAFDGKTCYMKFADTGTGGWHHIQIDNIKVENAVFG